MPMWPLIPVVILLGTMLSSCGSENGKGESDEETDEKKETEETEEFEEEIAECESTKGEPCTCNALVCCTSSENKTETVHIKKREEDRNILMADIAQLNRTDIEREKEFTVCKFSPDKKCTLDVTYIEDQEWKAYDESSSQGDGKELLNANESYMICTYGRGYLFFKDAGQVMRSEMEEMAKDQLLVTIEQLQNIPDGWQFRDMVSYNLTTSMPNYADGTRDITQDDVDELNRILWKYEINTPNRIAHFLAQTYVESQRGFGRVERYKTSDPITYFTGEYENNDKSKILGNTEKGDGPLSREAGAIHITGRANYQEFSNYMGDERIITDGALYVGQNYYWESAGFYWSIRKPRTANDDRYDLNKKCDENASVEVITRIINGGQSKLQERKDAYAYFSEVIQ